METFKQKYSASLNILLATVLFFLYVFVVFIVLNHSIGQSIPNIQDSCKFYPAFIIYVLIILKNIIRVKTARGLIYPIIFVMMFISLNIILILTFGYILSWVYYLRLLPYSLISLFCVEIFAVVMDIIDFKKEDTKSKVDTVCIIVSLFLILYTYYFLKNIFNF